MNTFLDLYDSARMAEDLKFMRTYRPLWVLLNSKEERIKHRSKYWGCWLRFHRQIKQTNNLYYVFKIMNSDAVEWAAFDYLNQKDKK